MPEKTRSEHIENLGHGSPFENVEKLQDMFTGHSIHTDEAIKVLAKHEGDQEWTLDEEKKLVKTIDRKLMPILFLTYGLQYYDKAMISQAV